MLVYFSVDMSTAKETLQNIVNRIVQEYLQPDLNNLTPKQDWTLQLLCTQGCAIVMIFLNFLVNRNELNRKVWTRV